MIDRSLSRGPGRPGRPTLDKETLGAIRDDLAWLLSGCWQDIGWQLPKAKTPEELRWALEPVRGHSSGQLLARFLRPTPVSATTEEIRLLRKARESAVEHLREIQARHDSSAAASRVAEQAMNESLSGQQHLAELLRRWGDSSNARKALEVASATLKTIEDQLVACRSEFVTADAAGGVRVFPLDRASIGGVGVDVAAKFAS
jgi:hypothetical protein